MTEAIRIYRAPVLTRWAAVVAERLGLPWETALTCGQAVAGMTAYSKDVRLGIYAPPEEPPHETAVPKRLGVTGNIRELHLFGRRVLAGETDAGPISKGELVKPASVERHLAGKFGEHLAAAMSAMAHLAKALPPRELAGAHSTCTYSSGRRCRRTSGVGGPTVCSISIGPRRWLVAMQRADANAHQQKRRPSRGRPAGRGV